MLRAEHDGVHAHGVILLVIFDGDLRLAVGTQIVHQLLLAHGGQALGQLVRERDRQRHELRRLVAGVAEHHALIARAVIERVLAGLLALERVVDAEGNVGALLVDVRDDGAGLAVKAILGAVIADLAHGLAHDRQRGRSDPAPGSRRGSRQRPDRRSCRDVLRSRIRM